jgi:hypothetical protein
MEKSIFPEIHILPSIREMGAFIGRVLVSRPTEAPLHMSNHYERSHFEPMDGEAYQPGLWD